MSYTKQLVNEEFVSNYELKSAKKVYGKKPGWCAKIQFKKKKETLNNHFYLICHLVIFFSYKSYRLNKC